MQKETKSSFFSVNVYKALARSFSTLDSMLHISELLINAVTLSIFTKGPSSQKEAAHGHLHVRLLPAHAKPK
jgi:hypothetical protein